jgi:hypothetical protein
MKKSVMKSTILGLAAVYLVGCASNAYKPTETDTELSAMVAKTPYPYSAHSEMAPHLFATVAPDATITIYNAGDESYANFQVWVNKTYALQVEKLDARSKIVIAPNTLFNGMGTNMGGATGDSVKNVQIWNKDTLSDVQGPILEH